MPRYAKAILASCSTRTRMKPSRENLLALALLLTVLVVNAAGLWPELSISRVDLNDNVLHFTLVERIVQAVERGENPLDCWSPEWSLGYPVLRTYQPLSHALVALVYFALGKSVGLMTIFVWVRFLSVVLLPLSFFAAARLMGLRPLTAAAAAILAPLVSTNFLYGIEYGSYTWAGSGLFPQAVATHFLLITLGLAFRSIRRGSRLALTGALLGLTFLAHLIYGYMGALSVCLLAVIPDAAVARGRSHPPRRHGGGGGPLALRLSVGAALARRLQHQSQPLGSGLEVGLLRRRRGIEMAVHRGTPGPRPPARAHAARPGRRRTVRVEPAQAPPHRRRSRFRPVGRGVLDAALFRPAVLGTAALHARRVGRYAVAPRHRRGADLSGPAGRHRPRRTVARAVAAAGTMPSRQLVTLLLLYPMVQERARNLANDARWGSANLAAHAAEPRIAGCRRRPPQSNAVGAPTPASPPPGAAASRSATSRSMPSPAARMCPPSPSSIIRWRSPRTSWSASTSGTPAITASSISAP